MPRNVRNFWLELDVDGKRTRVETGPQSKDGGFSLDVKMRDEGGIVRAALLTGYYAQQVRRDTVPGIKSGGGGTRPAWAPLLPVALKPKG